MTGRDLGPITARWDWRIELTANPRKRNIGDAIGVGKRSQGFFPNLFVESVGAHSPGAKKIARQTTPGKSGEIKKVR